MGWKAHSFTCFHWGMGAGRPCPGRQQDGRLTPRSCVGCDTHRPHVGGGTTWRQNKIKYIKVEEDIKKVPVEDRHPSIHQL